MNTLRPVFSAAFVLSAVLACAQQTTAEHVTKIDGIKPPQFDAARYEKEKQTYLDEYQAAVKKVDAARNEAILAFYKAFPDEGRIPDLLERRWLSLFNASGKAQPVLDDIAALSTPTMGKELKAVVDYCTIYVRLLGGEKGFKIIPAIVEYKTKHSKGPKYERLLQTAVYQVRDSDKTAVVNMFLKDFPDHRFAGMFKGILSQMDGVGKPFALKFKDAVTGKDTSIADMKGKVVMIDWWATWCGPCVAEMPRVKEIYKNYKDKGFEIIGVSLDNSEKEGGLTSLKEFVATNEMTWPQYYQGKGWDSEFSVSWGINSIPNVFLIDKKGILRDVEIQDLEKAIKKLLEER